MENSEYNREVKRFVSLLLPNQKQIYAFIRYLVPSRSDADDILQDTLTVMWSKFDEYQDETNFVSWGVTIAKYKILSFMRKKKSFNIHLSEKTINFLHKEVEDSQFHNTIIEQVDVLKECISKLSAKAKKLLHLRYEQDLTFEGIAGQFGISVPAIYKTFSLIHASLAKCIRMSLRLRGAL